MVHTRRAHAWLEVWGGERWHPLDPTDWVKFHPTHQFENPTDAPSPGDESGTRQAATDGAANAPNAQPTPASDNTGADERRTPFEDDEEYGGQLQPPPESPNRGLFGFRRRSLLDASERLRQWRSEYDDRALEEDSNNDAATTVAEPAATRNSEAPGVATLTPQQAEKIERQRLIQLSSRLFVIILAGFILLFAIRTLMRPTEPKKRRREDGESEGPQVSLVPLGAEILDQWDTEPTDPRGRVLFAYHRLQCQLQTVRLHRRPEETPHEHAERLSKREPELQAQLHAVADAVVRALYKTEQPTTSTHTTIQEQIRRIRQRVC